MPPLGNQPWQWEIDHPLNLASPSDMGTDVTLPDGQPAPDPVVYDIDGIENPKSTVTALHAMGDHVICYIEVGTAGDYYTAADEGTSTTYFAQLQAAGAFGNKLSGYPEYFLNIASPTTVSIIESMIRQQCADKGFDAVETDLDETYSGSDGSTGFDLTKAGEEQYVTTLADYMHSLGLGWIIKNPDDTADSFAADMEPLADGVLTEQCNQYSTCIYLASYEGHKAIFNAEYAPETTAEFCTADNALGTQRRGLPRRPRRGQEPVPVGHGADHSTRGQAHRGSTWRPQVPHPRLERSATAAATRSGPAQRSSGMPARVRVRGRTRGGGGSGGGGQPVSR